MPALAPLADPPPPAAATPAARGVGGTPGTGFAASLSHAASAPVGAPVGASAGAAAGGGGQGDAPAGSPGVAHAAQGPGQQAGPPPGPAGATEPAAPQPGTQAMLLQAIAAGAARAKTNQTGGAASARGAPAAPNRKPAGAARTAGTEAGLAVLLPAPASAVPAALAVPAPPQGAGAAAVAPGTIAAEAARTATAQGPGATPGGNDRGLLAARGGSGGTIAPAGLAGPASGPVHPTAATGGKDAAGLAPAGLAPAGLAPARDASPGPVAGPPASVSAANLVLATGAAPPPHTAAAASRASAPASAPAPSRTPPGPAGQVAPALVALANSPGGRHSMSLRLTPPALGEVRITLQRAAGGPAQIEIRAQRSDTLALLVQSQDQLHNALDRAGVPAAGRSLDFRLDTGGAGSQSQGFAARDGRAGGPSGGGAPQSSSRAEDRLSLPALPARLRRAGIDITA